MIQKPRFNHVLAVRLVVAVIYLGLATVAYAWGGFAHYRAAPAGLSWRVNLPDIAESSTPLGYLSYEVSDWFGWGHVCQRNGYYTLLNGSIIPNTPTSYGVPPGIEFAEWDMYYLRLKMTSAHREAENDHMMLRTAQGWLAHNIMDSVVHFSYFEGGSVDNWTTKHRTKEAWADLALFAQATTGYPDEPWGSYVHNMGASGHGGIICLAQKCFRKNRQTVDAISPYSGTLAPGPVESRAQNDARIAGQHATLNTATFTEGDYLGYKNIAANKGWNTATMLGLHATATASAAVAVAGMP